MKYVLLVYRDEKWWDALSLHERAAFEQACQASEQELVQRGHWIDFRNLQNQAALTVRIENDQVSLSDGPVCASQEKLVGLLTIEARDLNAAIQIAAAMPQARAGPIEVRPVDTGITRSP